MKRLLMLLILVWSVSGYATNFHYFMYGIVGTPDKYWTLSNILANATENDTIYIHLQGPGGSVDTVDMLEYQISQSKGKVVSVVDGDVASADAMIALISKHVTGNKNAWFLIHKPFFIVKGKKVPMNKFCEKYAPTQDCRNEIQRDNDSALRFFKNHVWQYLTEQQQKDVWNGKDVWIPASQFIKE